MNIELEQLIGKHVLTGAFNDAIGTVRVLRFCLDWINYEAVEDKEDGYRQSLECVRTTDTAPETVFPAIEVVGTLSADNDSDIILKLSNPKTGKSIIEIGTVDADDYYPGFVGDFYPQNI